jgi:transposase-like protein
VFKRRRFPVAIILMCVRWYCKYGISYRNLAEMMSERGVVVDPSTIFRWVQRYARRLRSGCDHTRDVVHAPGEWMRPMYEWADAGDICSERSINMVG